MLKRCCPPAELFFAKMSEVREVPPRAGGHARDGPPPVEVSSQRGRESHRRERHGRGQGARGVDHAPDPARPAQTQLALLTLLLSAVRDAKLTGKPFSRAVWLAYEHVSTLRTPGDPAWHCEEAPCPGPPAIVLAEHLCDDDSPLGTKTHRRSRRRSAAWASPSTPAASASLSGASTCFASVSPGGGVATSPWDSGSAKSGSSPAEHGTGPWQAEVAELRLALLRAEEQRDHHAGLNSKLDQALMEGDRRLIEHREEAVEAERTLRAELDDLHQSLQQAQDERTRLEDRSELLDARLSVVSETAAASNAEADAWRSAQAETRSGQKEDDEAAILVMEDLLVMLRQRLQRDWSKVFANWPGGPLQHGGAILVEEVDRLRRAIDDPGRAHAFDFADAHRTVSEGIVFFADAIDLLAFTPVSWGSRSKKKGCR